MEKQKLNLETLKEVINKQKDKAMIRVLPDPKKSLGALLYKTSEGEEVRNLLEETGKYDAALLEPYMITEQFGMTPNQFEKHLWEEGLSELFEVWNSYKDLQQIAMLHNEKYKTLHTAISEFVLNRIDKSTKMENPIIIKTYDIDVYDKLLELRDFINDDELYYKLEKEFISRGTKK